MSGEQFSGTAFSYIRFSSREQEQGDSIRRQRALRDEWLARQPGVTLDTSHGGEDRGVSAFRGRHRTDKHHLGRFVSAVQSGKVKSGSILLLESLDRLSREEVEDAVALLLSLLSSGVTIVQLEPYTVFRKGAGMVGLLTAILSLSRAHEESAMKSARAARVWKRKRAEAGGKILTARCPGWLEVVGGKFRFKPGAKATIARIYRLCVEGQGASLIANTFNAEDVPHWCAGSRWLAVYVNDVLRSPAVIGQFRPMTRTRTGEREPTGEVIERYYPQAVSFSEWSLAQKAVSARKSRADSPGRFGWVALFGPVFDARTGEHMHAIAKTCRAKGRYHVLQPPRVLRWKGRCVSFPLSSFENALRAKLAELDEDEVFPPVAETCRVAELKDELAAAELRRAEFQAALVGGSRNVDALPVLAELGDRCRKLAAELERARAEEAAPAGANLAALSELERAAAVETDPAVRMRYRACAGRVIESIHVLVVATVRTALRRQAYVQVRFRGSASVRDYHIVHKGADRGPKGSEPERWKAYSAKESETLDLRDPADVRTLERDLAELDLTRLA